MKRWDSVLPLKVGFCTANISGFGMTLKYGWRVSVEGA